MADANPNLAWTSYFVSTIPSEGRQRVGNDDAIPMFRGAEILHIIRHRVVMSSAKNR